jgi:hypothetical protein
MSIDATGRESKEPITMNGQNTNTQSIVSTVAEIKNTMCLAVKADIFVMNFCFFSRDYRLL